MPKAPSLRRPSTTCSGYSPVRVDLDRVHLVAQELLEARRRRPRTRAARLAGQREGVDQVQPEVAEEQLAQEAGLLPLVLREASATLRDSSSVGLLTLGWLIRSSLWRVRLPASRHD